MQIKSAKDLIVYKKAYTLAMEIFERSKSCRVKKDMPLLTKFEDLQDLFARI